MIRINLDRGGRDANGGRVWTPAFLVQIVHSGHEPKAVVAFDDERYSDNGLQVEVVMLHAIRIQRTKIPLFDAPKSDTSGPLPDGAKAKRAGRMPV